ncbi:MAG: 3-oxoacyl-ACP synthase III family protein [Candidatus Binatia bacterium]
MPKILGMGYDLPERRVDNDELARELGLSSEEIGARSGVATRFYAAAGEGPSHFAARAASRALAEASLAATDLEFLIFATMTPDVTFPGAGCYLQHKLACDTIGALDVRAQCAGLVFALDVADRFLRSGQYRRVLVAGGDVHSSGLDFSPAGADVTPRYGDGAAVFVLGAEGDDILATAVHTDATEFDRFWCEFPSSRRLPVRFLPSDFAAGKYFPKIDEDYVRKSGLEKIPSVVDEALSLAKIGRGVVSRYVFQHVFPDVAERAAGALGVRDRAAVGGRDGGHVASASLGITLGREREAGRVRPGDVVCLATAGAGECWGAAVVRL